MGAYKFLALFLGGMLLSLPSQANCRPKDWEALFKNPSHELEEQVFQNQLRFLNNKKVSYSIENIAGRRTIHIRGFGNPRLDRWLNMIEHIGYKIYLFQESSPSLALHEGKNRRIYLNLSAFISPKTLMSAIRHETNHALTELRFRRGIESLDNSLMIRVYSGSGEKMQSFRLDEILNHRLDNIVQPSDASRFHAENYSRMALKYLSTAQKSIEKNTNLSSISQVYDDSVGLDTIVVKFVDSEGLPASINIPLRYPNTESSSLRESAMQYLSSAISRVEHLQKIK